MKNKDIALIVGAVLIVLLAFLVMDGGDDSVKIEESIALSGDEMGLIEIDYSTYTSKVLNGENFIVIIERTGCSYCEMYMPIVEDASNDLAIPVYYIDIANLTEDEYNELNDTNSYLKKNKKWGTPTTLLMSGDVVVDSISGYVEKDSFVDFIEENINLSSEENINEE